MVYFQIIYIYVHVFIYTHIYIWDRHHCFKYPQCWWWPDSPQLCGGPIISMEFNWHKKEALLVQKYFSWSMSLLTTSRSFRICGGPEVFTSDMWWPWGVHLWYVVALRCSPLPQFVRNVVERLAWGSRNVPLCKTTRSYIYTCQCVSPDNIDYNYIWDILWLFTPKRLLTPWRRSASSCADKH